MKPILKQTGAGSVHGLTHLVWLHSAASRHRGPRIARGPAAAHILGIPNAGNSRFDAGCRGKCGSAPFLGSLDGRTPSKGEQENRFLDWRMNINGNGELLKHPTCPASGFVKGTGV